MLKVDREQRRKHFLKIIAKDLLSPRKALSYSVWYGDSPEHIRKRPCFATLWDDLRQTKTMVYLLEKGPTNKIKYILTLKNLKTYFNTKFDIEITNINPSKILLKIQPKDNINDIFAEAGLILIGVMLRSMDTEYKKVHESSKNEIPITTIETLINSIYGTRYAPSSHAIYSYFHRLDAHKPIAIAQYLKNIKTVFGTDKYDLTPVTLGQKYKASYTDSFYGIGYDYAYMIIDQLLQGELK